jgi:hypothetical protein
LTSVDGLAQTSMRATFEDLPSWRWRIVDYAEEMVEESSQTFPSIETAVADGSRRLREVDDQDAWSRSDSLHWRPKR